MLMAKRYLTGAPSFVAGWNFQELAACTSSGSYRGRMLLSMDALVTVPFSATTTSTTPTNVCFASIAFAGRQAGKSREIVTGGLTSVCCGPYTMFGSTVGDADGAAPAAGCPSVLSLSATGGSDGAS